MKLANALKHYFNIKYKGAVYQINCVNCGQSYIGESGRSFSIICREHMRDVDGWKPNRSSLSTLAISNDLKIAWVHIKTLGQENEYYKRKLLGSSYINKCNLTMNIKTNEYFPSSYETI